MRRINLKKKKGFTLVELILVIALIGVISVPVYGLFYTQHINTLRESYQIESQQEARLTVDLMLSDLRRYEAENSTYDEENNLKKLADGSTLKIKDGLSYYIQNGSLMKNDLELVHNVAEFSVKEESIGEENLISIDIKVNVGKGKIRGTDVEVHFSYRRKLSNRR